MPLLAAGGLSLAAAIAHLACIAGGPRWYLAMGAGERMAAAVAQGRWQPTLVTLAIATVLALWGLYAWSGAGFIRRLPLLRWVLAGVTAVYLARGLLFMPLQAHFPGNSPLFWYLSSAICATIGLVHLAGLWQAWPRLARS
ncbi:hypothetical protein [Pseudoduganella armeniaca]|uniref:DUF3995 domain-containing protein n=1 Tax=Pseudoduganella armeniaca TaxID=2072590 RepID=A0A2R4C9J2_9BURK|nr:hypothetical protein [Pseudoduganella armeniaca]AVR96255.1 hypothetical protein C9I28_11465 [Pseudoduganella armeniaca]